MNDTFVRKNWEEEHVLFYIHFQDGVAIRQIEVTNQGIKYLSLENPIQDESKLYDQSLEDLNLNEEDFITKEEFENNWNKASDYKPSN